jgi:rare lipoprotein A
MAEAAAQSGIASVYAYKSGRTASGERTSAGGLTAAHRSLPFGTKVRVTNRRNGHSVVVRINDRGPFVRGRVIDVTPAAARSLGFSGLAPVVLAVLR